MKEFLTTKSVPDPWYDWST